MVHQQHAWSYNFFIVIYKYLENKPLFHQAQDQRKDAYSVVSCLIQWPISGNSEEALRNIPKEPVHRRSLGLTLTLKSERVFRKFDRKSCVLQPGITSLCSNPQLSSRSSYIKYKQNKGKRVPPVLTHHPRGTAAARALSHPDFDFEGCIAKARESNKGNKTFPPNSE